MVGEEQTSEEKKKAGRVKRWVSKLEASKEAQKDHNERTAAAWKEYMTVADGEEARYPVYWSSVQTIQPALYARTPVPVAEREFSDVPDPLARLGSVLAERLAKNLIRATPFDRVNCAARDLFIHSGRTTVRVLFEGSVREEVKRTYYTRSDGPDGPSFLDDKGQLPEDGQELLTSEDGEVYAETTESIPEHTAVQLVPLHQEDILHTPNARHWDEIDWIAFRNLMTKAEVVKHFGKEALEYVKFTNREDAERKERNKSKTVPNESACIWEIWNKQKREVYWLADGCNSHFLKESADPYSLVGFFPCAPFMLGTVGNESLYTVPDYCQLKPSIEQLHGLSDRFKRLVSSAKRRGLADGSVPELQDLADSKADGDFIMIPNFKELIGDGGLEKLVWFFPTQEIVNAVNEMASVINDYETKFYELWGIPDIVRGVSDPNETASAQQLKGRYTSHRFSSRQREFQRVIRDTVEIMCDLALKLFPDDKLARVMGFDFLKPEEQEIFGAALALLRDDLERKLRINIETDSTITMNEQADSEQRTSVAKVLFDGLGALGQLAQVAPGIMPVLMEAVLFTVRGTRDGKQLEEGLEAAKQQMIQASQQPPQEPPVDQTKMLEIQTQQQKNQMDFQIAQAKLQLAQADLQVKANTLSIELQKIAATSQNEQQRLALDAQIADLNNYLETMRLDLETQYAGMELAEKVATEKRLQREEVRKGIGSGDSEAKPKAGNGALTIHLHQ